MAKQYYSYAIDEDSHLISAEDAIKGHEYHCPCCGAIMILKQGKIKRWHFAHKGNTENCSYESYLHKIAKRRICECFNESAKFTIRFCAKSICAEYKKCPLGASQPCEWGKPKEFEFDLKLFYNQCQEEATVDKFRADLRLTHSEKPNREPVLIEIWYTHKSTEEKLNSHHRIIEIHIESEEDIDEIVSTASIIESGSNMDECEYEEYKWYKDGNDKINFYNFNADSPITPDDEHQPLKYLFWIDSKGYYHLDENRGMCLSPNPPEIENSVFRIESKSYINTDFALQKLAESGIGIKYCTMCQFYKYNDSYVKSMCILYKSKGTMKFPYISIANNCPHFKQVDYSNDDNLLFEIHTNEGYRIYTADHVTPKQGEPQPE